MSRFWLGGAAALMTVCGVLCSARAASLPATEADPYCSVTGEGLKYMAVSSRKMAGLLEKIAAGANPAANIFLNRKRIEMFRQQMNAATNLEGRVMGRANMALDQMNAGDTLAAIEGFTEIENIQKLHPAEFGDVFLAQIQHYKALSYLRLGEQENCLTNHNSLSCLLPIQKEGVHRLQSGSRKAIEILQAQLNKTPRDRNNAWLLNIAYMTVGEYPNGVPAAWRIPASVFESEHDIKRFPDIAGGLGLDVLGLAGGTIAEDFDGDDDLDLFVTDWDPLTAPHYFQNNGDGSFSDRTAEAGLAGSYGGLHTVQGDYNNDGLMDILVLRGAWMAEEGNYPDSLLRNDGSGRFTDVTDEAGLMSFAPNQAAVWLDFDGDGWLDLYFGYESFGTNTHPCRLYRNNRNGTFTECGAAAGVNVIGFVKGVASGDYNNDGRPDLYLSRRGQPNILLRNDGPRGTNAAGMAEWKFTDVSLRAGVTEPVSSFPTWFFDYDNDGWEDIFVTGYTLKNVGDVLADYLGLNHNAERARLFRNNRDGTFKDVTKEANLHKVLFAMGCNYGDFDNDGWLDMHLGTGDPGFATLIPDRSFRNDGGKRFQDVTSSIGMGHLQKGHGVSFADLDNDGDQDVYHSVGGAFEGDYYWNTLHENPGHGNRWITLKLEGVKSNRAAIGARIRVVAENEDGTERSIYRTVSSGGSFGANPLRQEIGLGQAKAVKRVEIQWPATGRSQTISALEMGKFYKIREGAESAELLNVKSFHFAKGSGKSHRHALPK